MIRIDYRKGPLNYDLIFEGLYIVLIAIPFSDTVTSSQFTGEELIKVFEILYSS